MTLVLLIYHVHLKQPGFTITADYPAHRSIVGHLGLPAVIDGKPTADLQATGSNIPDKEQ